MGKEDSRKRTVQCTNTYGLICDISQLWVWGRKENILIFNALKFFPLKEYFTHITKLKYFHFIKNFAMKRIHENNLEIIIKMVITLFIEHLLYTLDVLQIYCYLISQQPWKVLSHLFIAEKNCSFVWTTMSLRSSKPNMLNNVVQDIN